MKKFTALLLCLVMVLLPLAGFAEEAGESSGFETNLEWKSVTFAGSDFNVDANGLHAPMTSNTIFVRSDKYIDGTVSFTMEYEVDILDMVDNDYVWSEGWMYYTFSFGLPNDEETTYDEALKNKLYLKGGVSVLPKTRDGVFIAANSEMELPDEMKSNPSHLSVKIEYAASVEEIVYTINGIELFVDYFEPDNHEGYIGIETAWMAFDVTKAVYTEYPDGLPSEQKEPTAEPTEEPKATEAPEEPTDAPVVTESQPDPTDKPADPTEAKTEEKEKGGNPALWITIGVIAAAAIAVAVVLILKKKKK